MTTRLPPDKRSLAEARRRGDLAYSPSLGVIALCGAGLWLLIGSSQLLETMTLLSSAAFAGQAEGVSQALGAMVEIVITALVVAWLSGLGLGLIQTRFAWVVPWRRSRGGLAGKRRATLAAARALLVVGLLAWLGFVTIDATRWFVSWIGANPEDVRAASLAGGVRFSLATLGAALLYAALELVAVRQTRWQALHRPRWVVERERRSESGGPLLRRRRRALERESRAALLATPSDVAAIVVDTATGAATAVAFNPGRIDRPAIVRGVSHDAGFVEEPELVRVPRLIAPELARATARLPPGSLFPEALLPRLAELFGDYGVTGPPETKSSKRPGRGATKR